VSELTPPARRVPRLRLPFETHPNLPGSKSLANRALIAAALSPGETRILSAGRADDVLLLEAGLQQMGFDLRRISSADEDVVLVRGKGVPAGFDDGRERRLDCGNAGTALRFLVSVAALVPGVWILDGDAHMRTRPVGDLVAAWRELGLEIEDTGGCPPIRIRGGHRRGGRVKLDASRSGQFLSSLLLVGAQLDTGLSIELQGELASASYVDLTIATLAAFGVDVSRDSRGHFTVAGPEKTLSASLGVYEVEADWSAVGAWTTLAAMTNGRVVAPRLRADSAQSDRGLAVALADLEGPGERTIDVGPMPDQLMNLAIFAARRAGDTRFVGAANLRLKECDRLAVTARELNRLGGRVEVEPDGLFIHGGQRLHGGVIDPEDDHRVAMAFAVLGTLVDGVSISSPDCVTKSYPSFWTDLEQALASPRPIALVGMRAAGKTSLGEKLAPALGLAFYDTDRVFSSQIGDIGAFVAARGWESFREQEAKLVETLLQPGRVVALGGGAAESARVRSCLRERAFTLWVDESEERVRERIAADPEARPALRLEGGDPVAEISALLARRRPCYEEVAQVRLPADESLAVRLARSLQEISSSCSW
jgi:3-phosphoshikimate 1-carboxyvinyltransferase